MNKINKISQPEEIDLKLYEHQLVSIYNMEERERLKEVSYHDSINEILYCTNIGVNADKSGYGKTMSMLMLIYRDKMKWIPTEKYKKTETTTLSSGYIKKIKIKRYEKLDTTLVLADKSIISQWYEECLKTPLSVNLIKTRKDADNVDVENYDIILVIPQMFNRLCLRYHDMAWKRFVFDEPSHVRVPSMRKIIAGFIWLVTSTPDNIISMHYNCRDSFMYNIIKEINVGSFTSNFDYLILKNDDSFVEKSYKMPPVHNIIHNCCNKIYSTLKGIIDDEMCRMISAGNISEVIKKLGGNVTDNIVELVKNQKEKELNDLEIKVESILNHSNNNSDLSKLKNQIIRLKGQIEKINERYTKLLNDNCSICSCKFKNPVLEPNCHNIFCGECLLKWMKMKSPNPVCPLCRHNIDPSKLIYIKNDNKISEDTIKYINTKLKTKIEIVIELIKNKPSGKFIIFSAWDTVFSPIQKEMINSNIKTMDMKGYTENRKKSIDDFKVGNIQVLFFNYKNIGTGLNLQEVTDIIIYHETTESILQQIKGRVNRIGRKEELYIHNFTIVE